MGAGRGHRGLRVGCHGAPRHLTSVNHDKIIAEAVHFDELTNHGADVGSVSGPVQIARADAPFLADGFGGEAG